MNAVHREACARYGLMEKPTPHDILARAYGDDTPEYRKAWRVVADAMQPQVGRPRACERCGGPVPHGKRDESRFCSPRCRRTAQMARYRQRLAESPMCQHCGKPCERREGEDYGRWRKRKYCDRACVAAVVRAQRRVRQKKARRLKSLDIRRTA